MVRERKVTFTSIDTAGVAAAGPDGVLPSGTRFGRYVIRRVLGQGGMGVVYEAFDPQLNRKIAIKVLRVAKGDPNVDTQSARARMLREAQAMAMVGHPNLVHVFDVGTYSDDVFIAMEFVDGVTLREWTTPRASDWKVVLHAYVEAGKGLSAAHKRKLIHRDFKPENVMVDGDGHVRVMDFGLARATGGADTSSSMISTPNMMNAPLTQTGMIMGTPAYMAPEQFLAEEMDHRTDQFSFCVALFEALYGYRPFDGDTMSQLARNVMRGQIRLPEKHPAPGYILDALLKGLQCDAADRHDDMDVLLDALTTEPDNTATGRSWIWPVTSALVLASGVALYWWSARILETAPAPEAPEPVTEAKTPPIPAPPEPAGVVTEDQMRRVVASYPEHIKECRERALDRGADLTGIIRLKFTIATDPENPTVGKIERVLLDDSRMFEKRAARCVLGMSMNWAVPAPACPAPATTCQADVVVDVGMGAPPDEAKAAPPKKPRGR